MKTVVVVQARIGSTRLPNKVLMPLAGRPLLQRMIERVMAAQSAFEIVVATTHCDEDAVIVDLARKIDVPVYAGHPTDLLDRHVRAARAFKADVVVKIPSDCPLIDPGVIDRVLHRYHELHGYVDYVSNLHPQSYPDGNDVEVVPMEILECAWREATAPHEREHTTPFIWDQPDRFTISNVAWESGRDFSRSHRWTIDYPADYAFISQVFDHLWSPERIFTMHDILDLLDTHPSLALTNAQYVGVNWYRHHLKYLRTISVHDTQQEPAPLSEAHR